MTAREPPRPAEPPLRCDHCGRQVRETEHTRTTYRVDYYTVHSGNGEVCSFAADEGQRGATYVKLIDRFDVVTCVECYGQASVQYERERRFHPERDAVAEQEHP
jgi:hypothetical protein